MRKNILILTTALSFSLLQTAPTHAYSLWPFNWEEVTLIAEAVPREYHTAPTAEQTRAIGTIVNTLADTPTPKLLFYKTELEAAGKLIDRVHPLRFLMVVFTDEQMKVSIRNMKKKGGLAWKNFSAGLYGGLQDESELNNMQDAFVRDFSQVVGIKPSLISSLIEERRWDDFLESLMNNIPRKGDYRRYDY